MAKKKSKDEPTKDENRDLVAKVRERFKVMHEADQENRNDGIEDFKFVNVPGYQWDADMKKKRGKRPCYEFNELRIKCKRIINDMRANRAQAKVRGYEDSDKPTAEIIEGLCRNIWNTSDADTIIDAAGDYQVSAGFGAWRVVTDYEDDRSFNQDIYVEAIPNPFCLYWDPSARDALKRDAEDWILTEKISKKAYETKYPDKAVVDFESADFDDDQEWASEEEVRIAEYWWKEPVDIEMVKLGDGRVVEAEKLNKIDTMAIATNPAFVVARRKVRSHKIMMAIVSGEAVLEKPKVCAGRQHRFVVVFGEQMVVEGNLKWWGLPRFSKDSQRNLNLTNTIAMEATAKYLQSPYWATSKQAEGHAGKWGEAFNEGFPVALYNSDPAAPGPPQRTGGPELPVAMLELGNRASGLLNSTSGIYETNVGNQIPGAKSGRAIIATQQQGEITSFNFQDNMSKAVQRTHEIFLDLIPEIYDTERALRVLGTDGSENYVKINQVQGQDPVTGTLQKLNDISRGRFDVTITVGPNFSTKRQEAAELYGQLAQAAPGLMDVAGDLIIKAHDLPYSEDIAERMKAMLPPPIQKMISKDQNQSPEVAMAMAQADQAMQQVQQMGQMVQEAAAEAEQKKAEAEKAQSAVKVEIANLKTQMAQFKQLVAETQMKLATERSQIDAVKMETEAKEQVMAATAAPEEARNAVVAEAQQAIGAIQSVTGDFMREAVQVLSQVRQPKKRKPKRIDMLRTPGKPPSIVPVYDENEPRDPNVPEITRFDLVRGPNGSSAVPVYN